MLHTGQSPRHLWEGSYPVDRCRRCGAFFSYNGMDAHGPCTCHPTPAWLKAHPEDDGKER